MLVTVAEVKNYLSITSNSEQTNDANIATLANYASNVVESYCGRGFASANVTEFFSGGKTSIFVTRIPINNVTQVAEYDGMEYIPLNGPANTTGELPNLKANTTTVEFTFDKEIGKITRDLGSGSGTGALNIVTPPIFSDYVNGVKVQYNGGYDTIPNDLKLATLDYIKIIYKQEQGTQAFSFQGETKSPMPLTHNFPPHVKRILDLYRVL